jgi:cellulose synthase/poly-beta-1,6-N-acetylglucosamine synthase-like glycosyltransferase
MSLAMLADAFRLSSIFPTVHQILLVALLVVAYVLIGYPLLLALAPWRTAPPVAKDLSFRPTVSVLMAVYNGAGFIAQKLESLLALEYPRGLTQILVASDGSTDGTDRIVEGFADQGVRLLSLPRRGKAAALTAALQHATGEILFFTDVRQTLEPNALTHLVANFADPTVGAVTGQLRILDARPGEEADMELYWNYELWARRHHSRIDSIFSVTGCVYALRRALAQPLPAGTLTDDAWLSLGAFFRGYRVVFEPDALAYDHPATGGGEFRRKLRTLAGLWQLHARLPRLFSEANRMRFHFLSYKFSRLILPWAILAAGAAILALPASHLRDSLIISVLAFLAIALLYYVIPKRWSAKRVSSPVRTFLVMNAAALLSVAVFFVPAASLWKQPTPVVAGSPDAQRNIAGRES